jgi:hypothetical protein
MNGASMSKAGTPTEQDIRTRLDPIAAEASVNASDQHEPLQELIDRIRFSLEEELTEVTRQHNELCDELDECEEILAEQQTQPEKEEQT